jgi:hypothetical protein
MFILENPGKYHLSQVIKVNITYDTHQNHELLIGYAEKGSPCVFPKLYNLSLVRKHHGKPNQWTFYKITSQYYVKMSRRDPGISSMRGDQDAMK